jgi:hypothetical protein
MGRDKVERDIETTKSQAGKFDFFVQLVFMLGVTDGNGCLGEAVLSQLQRLYLCSKCGNFLVISATDAGSVGNDASALGVLTGHNVASGVLFPESSSLCSGWDGLSSLGYFPQVVRTTKPFSLAGLSLFFLAPDFAPNSLMTFTWAKPVARALVLYTGSL